MSTWSRRNFITGLGVATIATACKRAPAKVRTDEVGVAPTPTQPATPGPRELPAPGFSRMGRSQMAFDGEQLLEVHDGILLRRDASLAVVSRLPLERVRSFAILSDRSLLVLTESANGTRSVPHVVAAKVVTSRELWAELVLASAAPNAFWAVDTGLVKRTPIAPESKPSTLFLPENTDAFTAEAASDGLLVASSGAILHLDQEITRYAWNDKPTRLAVGAEPKTVWAELGMSKLALLKLEAGRATATATYAMAPGENMIHMAGNGTHALTIMARTIEPLRAAFTLVVFDAKGERWRAPLGEFKHGGFVSVGSQTRVVTLDVRSNELRAWDLATGKPA